MTAFTILEKGSDMDMTPIPVDQRDYSLVGEDGRRAVEIGLASAEWYHSDVPRKVMKDLMQRSDGPALRDTVVCVAVWGRRRWGLVLGNLGLSAVLFRLRRDLRIIL
jgi:hypothetical protein